MAFLGLAEAAARYKKKFPDKELLTYDGAQKAVVIFCPKHGEQPCYSYNMVIRSKSGCPRCGNEASEEALTTAIAELKRQRDAHRDALMRIDSLYSGGLDDKTFKEAVGKVLEFAAKV